MLLKIAPAPLAQAVVLFARMEYPLGSIPLRPEGESKRGGRSPLLGRFKGMGFSGEGENRNPPSLERFFAFFLCVQKEGAPLGPASPKTNKFALRLRWGIVAPPSAVFSKLV